jgi:hypothetical protein
LINEIPSGSIKIIGDVIVLKESTTDFYLPSILVLMT